MAVEKKDIWVFGSANMVESDSGTVGGAIAVAVKCEGSDPSTTSTIECYCAAADTTRTVTITGRSASGAIVSEVETFNGLTAVTTTQTFERLLKAILSDTPTGTCAVISSESGTTGTNAQSVDADFLQLEEGQVASDGDFVGQVLRITTASGDGTGELAQIIHSVAYDGSPSADQDKVFIRQWGEGSTPSGTIQYKIAPGYVFEQYTSPSIDIQTVRRPGYDQAAPAAGETVRYEKLHIKNTHATTDLTNATVSEGSGGTIEDKIAFDLEDALDDNDTSTNRITDPGVYTFDSSSDDVPNSGTLTAGSAIGIWLETTLASTDTAANSYYQPVVAGQST